MGTDLSMEKDRSTENVAQEIWFPNYTVYRKRSPISTESFGQRTGTNTDPQQDQDERGQADIAESRDGKATGGNASG